MNVDKIRLHHTPKGDAAPELIIRIKAIPKLKQTYVAFNEATGLTKIGRSTNYGQRLMDLENQAKRPLRIVAVFNRDCEALLHTKFSIKRVIGEWFRLTGQDITDLRFVSDH